MKRCTIRDANGVAHFKRCLENPKCQGKGCKDYKCRLLEEMAEALAEYEEAVEGHGHRKNDVS